MSSPPTAIRCAVDVGAEPSAESSVIVVLSLTLSRSKTPACAGGVARVRVPKPKSKLTGGTEPGTNAVATM